MWDMVQNIYKKVSVNLNFVENNNLQKVQKQLSTANFPA